jgi:hypothetical protein
MITEAQWAAERQGSYRFTTEQPMYSIFTRKHEAAVATAFVRAHPAVTSVLIGPRIADQLDGLLSGADTELPADVLDRIDEIVPPGTDLDPQGQLRGYPASDRRRTASPPVADPAPVRSFTSEFTGP